MVANKSGVAVRCLTPGKSTAHSAGDYSVGKRVGMIARHVELWGSRVLDVGCGNGLYTLGMAELGAEATGVDLDGERLLEAAESRERRGADAAQFAVASGSALPFADDSFDVVTMIEVLEHVEEERRALSEVRRVLRPDGRLVMFVPNKLWFFESHGMRLGRREIRSPFIPLLSWAPEFVRRRLERARIYSRGRLLSLLRREGFSLRAIDYMWPPMDQKIGPLRNDRLRLTLRGLANRLERSPLRMFGLSIFVVFRPRGKA